MYQNKIFYRNGFEHSPTEELPHECAWKLITHGFAE